MKERNNSFVCYASFVDMYNKLKQSPTPEMAYKFIDAVFNYGLYGEYTEGEDLFIDALMESVKISIDGAQSRYNKAVRRGITGGAPAKYDEEAILAFLDEGHTQKEASERFGCALSTIKRYVKARKDQQKEEEEEFVASEDWNTMF